MIENVGYGGSFSAPIAGMCIEHYLYGRLIRFDKDATAKAPIALDMSTRKKNMTDISIKNPRAVSGTH
jgi:hypothetical protein